jgi:hypothetical protein
MSTVNARRGVIGYTIEDPIAYGISFAETADTWNSARQHATHERCMRSDLANRTVNSICLLSAPITPEI